MINTQKLERCLVEVDIAGELETDEWIRTLDRWRGEEEAHASQEDVQHVFHVGYACGNGPTLMMPRPRQSCYFDQRPTQSLRSPAVPRAS